MLMSIAQIAFLIQNPCMAANAFACSVEPTRPQRI
jgi:hypothetical protein